MPPAGQRAGPWTDAHCHLADPRLAGALAAVVARSRAAGITGWVQAGVGPEDWPRQWAVRQELGAQARVCVGLHPWWVSQASDEQLEGGLRALEAAVPEACGLGELGLDALPRWRRLPGAQPRQLRAFVAQLELVRRVPRPLVLHMLGAHRAALDELERHGPFVRGGIVHSFSGTLDDARRYVALGLHLSVGGALAARPDRAASLKAIAPQWIVVETDAPDQAPRSWQVAHNEPAFLPRIAEALAPVWGISAVALLDQAHLALQRLFPP